MLSSFLIEGAGREKLSPVLSLKSNSQCQIVIRRPLCRRRSEMCQVCARDIKDTFVTAMYTVDSDHILGTDLFRIEIYADQMCHVNAATVYYII